MPKDTETDSLRSVSSTEGMVACGTAAYLNESTTVLETLGRLRGYN